MPGDILKLAAGDMIPADVRIVAAKDLFVMQSSLTGEAFPPFTFTGDPGADFNSISGVLNGSGFVNQPILIVRQ